MKYQTVGIVIPCLNEELAIAQVVSDCRRALPGSAIYVFNNNSSDQTAARAEMAGAKVIFSPLPGKGEVIRHAFSQLQEDYLIVLDGDGTYPAEIAPQLLDIARKEAVDMLVVTRRARVPSKAFPKYHRMGNLLFSLAASLLLKRKISDLFSGYRVISRGFYEKVSLEAKGFEIESEMTFKAVLLGFHLKEVDGEYRMRPAGSESKISTFLDGWRILCFILFMDKKLRI